MLLILLIHPSLPLGSCPLPLLINFSFFLKTYLVATKGHTYLNKPTTESCRFLSRYTNADFKIFLYVRFHTTINPENFAFFILQILK